MKFFVVFSLLISIVFAQHGGNGISKSTWGSSDPNKCAAWFKKYLPAVEASDSCRNGICTCAVQGRYQLEGIGQSGPGGYGIHTINCTHHPYGEYSMADIEKKFQKEWGNFNKFHPFMDYNAGFWAQDLDEYVEKFIKDKVPMTTIRWQSDDDNVYYSIIVNPCGYVVFELMGDSVSEKYHSLFTIDPHMRFSMKSKNNLPSSSSKKRNLASTSSTDTSNYGFGGQFGPGGRMNGGRMNGDRLPPGGGPHGQSGSSSWNIDADKILYPISISRATTNLAAVRKFYNSEIGAKEVYYKKYDTGVEHSIIMFDIPSDVGIQMHFWQNKQSERQKADKANGGLDPIVEKELTERGDSVSDDMEWTIKHFEMMLDEVHKKYIVSNICGFDQWIDNHFAYDGAMGRGKDLDDYADHFEKNGLLYRWWSDPRGHVLYGVDPTGWGVQFDGQAKNPPSNAPQYKATCESDDGCLGQGAKGCSAQNFYNMFLQ